jgi:hypothetical protein
VIAAGEWLGVGRRVADRLVRVGVGAAAVVVAVLGSETLLAVAAPLPGPRWSTAGPHDARATTRPTTRSPRAAVDGRTPAPLLALAGQAPAGSR